jgi:outer membrane scaffolding protein for murein synthesis (MipA/OmpV family)
VLFLAPALCPADAEELPLWELGVGATAFTLPNYIGANEQSYYALPIPYFVYRGKVLKVNREAISGKLFSTDRLRLALGVNGSLPVDSDHNDAREGMPNLDLLAEFGPNVRYLVYVTPERRHRVLLDLPARAVFSFDVDDVDHRGYTSTPTLRYTYWKSRWLADVSAGIQIADDEYNNYFYGVNPAFVTDTRREYDADAGYGGLRLGLGLSRRTERWWVGAFFRFADLNGATFSDSPLVLDHQGLGGGIAFAWLFARSSKTVDFDRDLFE